MSHQRVRQSTDGTLRVAECFVDSRKFVQGRIREIYFASSETGHADSGSNTNFTYIHAKNGAAIKIDARGRGEDGNSADVVQGSGIGRSTDSGVVFIGAANVRLADRLPRHEKCFTASYQEAMYDHKLYIGESELLVMFGQAVGTFGQVAGVG